ncbi:AP2-like ethylene-responsive transcription factor ANT [Magnolia sinica]|uniref:AP2-like ethylene-responsive transcription factor ANT n=1 Tax=Magnolia sinica TaxID=86752 RepID=UPI002658CFBD|nr:AP2-like ethylene-responsive transcription factor ANT [Magnolia sinica]
MKSKHFVQEDCSIGCRTTEKGVFIVLGASSSLPPSSATSSSLSSNTSYSCCFSCSSNQLLSSSSETQCGALYSQLSVMPLKSDGSLCIMEALTRSQQGEGVMPASSPKLEDFLDGATMGAHQYGFIDREAISLSLDNMYYQHNPQVENSRQQHSLSLLQLFGQLI